MTVPVVDKRARSRRRSRATLTVHVVVLLAMVAALARVDRAAAVLSDPPASMEDFANSVGIVAEVEVGDVVATQGAEGSEEVRVMTVRRPFRNATVGKRVLLGQVQLDPGPGRRVWVEDAAAPLRPGDRVLLFLVGSPTPSWAASTHAVCIYRPGWGLFGEWAIHGTAVEPYPAVAHPEFSAFQFFLTNREADRAAKGVRLRTRSTFTVKELLALKPGRPRSTPDNASRSCATPAR